MVTDGIGLHVCGPLLKVATGGLLQQVKPLTADIIVSSWLDAIRAVAGKPLKNMHKSMSPTGRMQ